MHENMAFSGLIRPETKEEKRIRLGLKNMIFPDGFDMAKYNAHLEMMKKKHPQMKPSRMQRKVAQYFKIKLVD